MTKENNWEEEFDKLGRSLWAYHKVAWQDVDDELKSFITQTIQSERLEEREQIGQYLYEVVKTNVGRPPSFNLAKWLWEYADHLRGAKTQDWQSLTNNTSLTPNP